MLHQRSLLRAVLCDVDHESSSMIAVQLSYSIGNDKNSFVQGFLTYVIIILKIAPVCTVDVALWTRLLLLPLP